MSQRNNVYVFSVEGFPRVSGDEPPIHKTVESIGEFSPRERG